MARELIDKQWLTWLDDQEVGYVVQNSRALQLSPASNWS